MIDKFTSKIFLRFFLNHQKEEILFIPEYLMSFKDYAFKNLNFINEKIIFCLYKELHSPNLFFFFSNYIFSFINFFIMRYLSNIYAPQLKIYIYTISVSEYFTNNCMIQGKLNDLLISVDNIS